MDVSCLTASCLAANPHKRQSWLFLGLLAKQTILLSFTDWKTLCGFKIGEDLPLGIHTLFFTNASSTFSYHFSSLLSQICFTCSAQHCNYTWCCLLTIRAWCFQSSFLLWIHQQPTDNDPRPYLLKDYGVLWICDEDCWDFRVFLGSFACFCLQELSYSIAAVCHGSHLVLGFFPSFLTGEYNMTKPSKNWRNYWAFYPLRKK